MRRKNKLLSFLLCFSLLFEQAGFAQIAGELDISGHLALFRNSLVLDKFRPLHLRSLQYLPQDNSFKLLLDKGDQFSQNRRVHFTTSAEGDTFRQSYGEATQKESVPLDETKLKDETKVLLNYFFIGLTLPNSSFWVNLRPDAEDNIIDDYLAKTDVGKILLEADLQLKKDTAKFTSPETPEGKLYWDKLYQKAGELLGNENITIPTLTRPWIVPGEIIIRETKDNAYIYKATLKVMLEQDYLKDSATYNFSDSRLKALNEYSSQLIRELIIPKLTKEVNTSKRYASLRQVYYSLILAQWFKARHQGLSPKGTVPDAASALINSHNLTNLISKEAWSKTTYFQAYQKSFKDGEYNIQQPAYTPTGQVIRSYFSGGLSFGKIPFSSASPTSGSPIKQITDSTILFETAGEEGISPLTGNDIPALAVIGNPMNPLQTNITIIEEAPLPSGSPAERSPQSGASSLDALSVANSSAQVGAASSPAQQQPASSAAMRGSEDAATLPSPYGKKYVSLESYRWLRGGFPKGDWDLIMRHILRINRWDTLFIRGKTSKISAIIKYKGGFLKNLSGAIPLGRAEFMWDSLRVLFHIAVYAPDKSIKESAINALINVIKTGKDSYPIILAADALVAIRQAQPELVPDSIYFLILDNYTTPIKDMYSNYMFDIYKRLEQEGSLNLRRYINDKQFNKIKEEYTNEEIINALILNNLDCITNTAEDIVMDHIATGWLFREMVPTASKNIQQKFTFTLEDLKSYLSDMGINLADSEIVQELTKRDLRVFEKQGKKLILPLVFDTLLSGYRGSAEVDHADARYLTYGPRVAFMFGSSEKMPSMTKGGTKNTAYGPNSFHEFDLGILNLEGKNRQKIDPNAALAIFYKKPLPEYARKRTVVIEGKTFIEHIQELTQNQLKERRAKQNILRILNLIAEGNVKADVLSEALDTLKQEIEIMHYNCDLKREYWEYLFGYLDEDFYNRLKTIYHPHQSNRNLINSLLQEKIKDFEVVKIRQQDNKTFPERIPHPWKLLNKTILDYLEYAEQVRQGTFDEVDVSTIKEADLVIETTVKNVKKGTVSNLADISASPAQQQPASSAVEVDKKAPSTALPVALPIFDKVTRSLLHSLPSDRKIVINVQSDFESKELTTTVEEALSLEKDNTVVSIQIKRIPQVTANPMPAEDTANKFDDNWITRRADGEVLNVMVQFASGETAAFYGNKEMLIELAQQPEVTRVLDAEAPEWLRIVYDIPQEERGTNADWLTKLADSFGAGVVMSSEQAKIAGMQVYHGTISALTDSVKSGPKNVGKGFGGRGLYLAVNGERDIAEYFAKIAAIEYRDTAGYLSGEVEINQATGRQAVILVGRINPERQLRVGKFEIRREISKPDLVAGVLPATWDNDPNLRALLEREFDILDLRGMRSHGLAIDTDCMLVVHQRAGADSIIWDVSSPIINEPIQDKALSTDNKGGIDFRALPVVSSPINPTMLKLSPAEIKRLSNLNLDSEWAEIQNMLKAGIIPSNERVKEYVASSCLKQSLGNQMGKVLGCIANILRIQEERVTETEPELENMLVLIKSGRPANELQSGLSQITILPKEPRLLGQ
ncbi:MAG: hypothetical protein Q7K98_03325 [Candidatus Omnitrophota bacterium]|nr:hypothetical protein [Candidatus Omnitrophota bacterium]